MQIRSLRVDPLPESSEAARVSPEHTDLQDIIAIARGDQDALGRLYDHYGGIMMALGIRVLGNRDAAEDVLHDVFLEVWARAGDFDPRRGTVKAWLIVRMRSRCLDRLKSPKFNVATPRLSQAAGTSATDQSEAAMSIDGPLAALPEDQRQVLILGYFDGLSFSEISTRLGVPLGTVKSRAAAAMTKLRGEFAREQGNP